MRIKTVGDLRRIIENVPDDCPVVVPVGDHTYAEAYAQLETADIEGRNVWEADLGTPPATSVTRREVLVVT